MLGQSLRDKVLASALSLAAAVLPGCVAPRGGTTNREGSSATSTESSQSSPIALELSSSVKNRYAASGFVLGKGPVAQNSLNAEVLDGPLAGTRFGTWTNIDIGGIQTPNEAFHEMDLYASIPILREPVEVRLGGQQWRFGPQDGVAYLGELSINGRLPGVGVDVSGLVRHLFPHDGKEQGNLFEVGASHFLPLNSSGTIGVDLGARAGQLDNFFGVDGRYITPEAGLNLKLSDDMSLRFFGGYQFGSPEPLKDQPLAGITFTLKF